MLNVFNCSLLTGDICHPNFAPYAHARIRLVEADTVVEIFTWIFCIHLDIFVIFYKKLITEITKIPKSTPDPDHGWRDMAVEKASLVASPGVRDRLAGTLPSKSILDPYSPSYDL